MGDMADRARELEGDWRNRFPTDMEHALRDLPVEGAEAEKHFQIRHRRDKPGWLLHAVRYSSYAEAEAMARGLGYREFEIVEVHGPKVWLTWDKRRLQLTDMTTQHLLNTLNMLYRRMLMKSLSYYRAGQGAVGERVIEHGPAAMFPDKGSLAGWPSLIAEYRRREPQYLPKEWR